MPPNEAVLRQEFDEALGRVDEAERAMSKAQAKLDTALRDGHDTALSRRLQRECQSLMLSAKTQVDQARAALDAYVSELDRTAAERMMHATRANIDALLARFDTSDWEKKLHAN